MICLLWEHIPPTWRKPFCSCLFVWVSYWWGFPGGSEVKVFACNVGDLGSIPGLGRSPGGGNGNPLQYSCLENPMEEEPGGLQSMGSQRVGHDWATSFHFRLDWKTIFYQNRIILTYFTHICFKNPYGILKTTCAFFVLCLVILRTPSTCKVSVSTIWI